MEEVLFLAPPEGFDSKLYCVGCYLLCQGKLLLAKRHPEKSQGDTWGVPGGKKEGLESDREALIREVKEEVGINLEDSKLIDIGLSYGRFHDLDYIFHMFFYELEQFPELSLALDEHTEAKWVFPEEARKLPLISGGSKALDFFLQFLAKSKG